MTDEEREALAQQVDAEVRPLLDVGRMQDGYDCCGCSTYAYILDHCLALIRGQTYSPDTP